MKKLALSMLAAVALSAAGAAMAQDGGAECQGLRHSGGGTCGGGPTVPHYPYSDAPMAVPPGAQYGPYVYRDGLYWPQYQAQARPAYPQARPSRRDRDGDGVSNRYDRHPDDPYRR